MLADAIAGCWRQIQREDPPDPRSVPLPVREAMESLGDAARLVAQARDIAAGRSAEEQVAVEAACQFWLELHGLPASLFGCPELPDVEPCETTTLAVFERLVECGLPAPARH